MIILFLRKEKIRKCRIKYPHQESSNVLVNLIKLHCDRSSYYKERNFYYNYFENSNNYSPETLMLTMTSSLLMFLCPNCFYFLSNKTVRIWYKTKIKSNMKKDEGESCQIFSKYILKRFF